MKAASLLRWFRTVALMEGISFLLLLGIAMPLKYYGGLPAAVKLTGMIHGVLFIAFIILAWETSSALQKKTSWFAKACIASIVPFGTFILDKELKKEAAAMER